MKRFIKNKWALGLTVIVLLLSIVIGVVNALNPEVTFVENVVQVVVTPAQKLFTNMGNGIAGFFGHFTDIDKLNTEVNSLKEENARLKEELNKSEISTRENDELRKLLSLKESYPELELKGAQVIARNPSNWYGTFTIDKGTADGVSVNQPVISADRTLVGRISEVGTTWARIVTINDPAHSVGVEVVRSGEYGIVEGESSTNEGGNCRLSFISKNANIIVGDKVVTSGLGGVYPRGLTIGKVLDIRPDMQGISQYAIISPEADIENLKAVMIVVNDMSDVSNINE